MNLEQQVCSLGLAKRLRELGVKQESLFYWETSYETPVIRLREEVINNFHFHHEDYYSAYSCAELGNILPNGILLKEGEPFNSFRISILKFISVEDNKLINNWIINYECDSTACAGEEAWLRRRLTSNIYDPNLANAMAKMLIWLLENNHVCAEDL